MNEVDEKGIINFIKSNGNRCAKEGQELHDEQMARLKHIKVVRELKSELLPGATKSGDKSGPNDPKFVADAVDMFKSNTKHEETILGGNIQEAAATSVGLTENVRATGIVNDFFRAAHASPKSM